MLAERCETAGILDVAGSQAMKEVDGVVEPTPEGWAQNRAARKISERIVQVVNITLCECLQQRIEEIVEVVKVVLEERVRRRIVEQAADVPVR